uniref:Methyltransferase domain-containing protein n=1 Tax=Photinus pyralis TaxID=7054 RepID=A0A1Y1LA07_PHOPY
MNKPDLYSTHVTPHSIEYYKSILDKYLPKIRHGNNNNKSALDIGCGPGRVTHDVILPYVKQEIDEIIGVDISVPMIEHAQKTYANDQVNFKVVNAAEPVPEDFVERFDYIFSFMTLQWILDQWSLFSNILKMLKPNGSFLVTYIAKSKMTDIYNEVRNIEVYSPYIPYRRYAPFHNSEDPQQELTSILRDTGFEDIHCEVNPVRFDNYSRSEIESFFVSILPYYDCIPNHLKKQFLADHADRMCTVTGANGEEEYYIEHNMFIAHGRRI